MSFFLKHVWQSDYRELKQENIDVLKVRTLLKGQVSPGEAVVNGWGKLITAYVTNEDAGSKRFYKTTLFE